MIDLKPACHAMVELLTGVRDSQIATATPCSEYNVGDLIDHVDTVSLGSTALASNDIDGMTSAGNETGAARRDAHWRGQVAEHVTALGIAWENPEAWEGSGKVPGSELSNATWAKIALTELVVHGWDIAVATGQPFTLPELTLQACFEHVAEFVPNAPVPALWGPAVDVATDAPLLDRIVAITGRQP